MPEPDYVIPAPGTPHFDFDVPRPPSGPQPGSPYYWPPDSVGSADNNDQPTGKVFSEGGWDHVWEEGLVPGSRTLKTLGRTEDRTGGGGSGSSWSGTYVNDALTAASMAIQSFLSGQSLADARKLSAAEQFQKMAAFALPAGSTTAPGFERGGAAQHLAALQGRPTYTPPPIQTQRVNPSALIEAGQVPQEIMDFIQTIIGAGDSGGKVVTTGGSSSSS